MYKRIILKKLGNEEGSKQVFLRCHKIHKEEETHTGIDPIQELLLSVRGLASVITNIELKQEQQYKDIQKFKEK
jgi:hypothetical protein